MSIIIQRLLPIKAAPLRMGIWGIIANPYRFDKGFGFIKDLTYKIYLKITLDNYDNLMYTVIVPMPI